MRSVEGQVEEMKSIKTALQHIQSTSNDFHTANDILDDQVESEIHRGHTSIVIVYKGPEQNTLGNLLNLFQLPDSHQCNSRRY